MIYISYDLSTFKTLAKQLKRIYREVKPNVLTMDCLDVVAKAHNAKGWNDLYKTHQMAIDDAKEGKNLSSSSAFFFLEDLSFKARIKLLDDVFRKMSAMGVPLEVIEEYGAKAFSIYAPTSSEFFIKTFSEGIEKGAVKYTSFDDMHGNLFLATASKKKHSLFLKKEVIPGCLSGGGLLVLSSEQYHECQHLLSGDNVQTIHLESDKPMTPLSWSDNASIEKVEEYYFDAFFSIDARSMWEGRTASFFSAVFYLWKRIENGKLPVGEVQDFSPVTVDKIWQMCADSVAKFSCSGLGGFLNVDVNDRDWVKKLRDIDKECWECIVMGVEGLHKVMVANSGKKNEVHVDSIFDDLSKTTVIVSDNLTASKPSFKYSSYDCWVREDALLGFIGLLSSVFKKRREDRLLNLNGRSVPKYVVYTSPNSIAVQRVASELVVENGPNLKMINSVLVEPPKSDDLLVNPKELKLDDIKTFGFEEKYYRVLKQQADYVLNLNKFTTS